MAPRRALALLAAAAAASSAAAVGLRKADAEAAVLSAAALGDEAAQPPRLVPAGPASAYRVGSKELKVFVLTQNVGNRECAANDANGARAKTGLAAQFTTAFAAGHDLFALMTQEDSCDGLVDAVNTALVNAASAGAAKRLLSWRTETTHIVTKPFQQRLTVWAAVPIAAAVNNDEAVKLVKMSHMCTGSAGGQMCDKGFTYINLAVDGWPHVTFVGAHGAMAPGQGCPSKDDIKEAKRLYAAAANPKPASYLMMIGASDATDYRLGHSSRVTEYATMKAHLIKEKVWADTTVVIYAGDTNMRIQSSGLLAAGFPKKGLVEQLSADQDAGTAFQDFAADKVGDAPRSGPDYFTCRFEPIQKDANDAWTPFEHGLDTATRFPGVDGWKAEYDKCRSGTGDKYKDIMPSGAAVSKRTWDADYYRAVEACGCPNKYRPMSFCDRVLVKKATAQGANRVVTDWVTGEYVTYRSVPIMLDSDHNAAVAELKLKKA